MNWHKWIGKKHKTGADPVYEDGCDCLIMVVRIRENLGLPSPSKSDVAAMISFSEAGSYDEIYNIIDPHLVKLNKAEDGAFTIFETPDQIGAAVMIENGILSVHHTKGVRWTPSNAMRRLNWHHWK